MRTDTLAVPGATLYYEIRGAGPTLLLICGGVYDAAGYAGLAERLADRYTVVTYDRRGNSRSPLTGPPTPQQVEEHAEDARRILAAVDAEPALVFGNSSGASIGLELVARHPELVRVLVAHEPPVFDLLDDREHWATLMTEVEQAYARDGAAAAGAVFGAGMHMRGGSSSADGSPSADGTSSAEPERIPGGAEASADLDPELAAMMGRMQANMEFFIGYEVPPFGRFSPDLPALRAAGTRILPAVGAESEGEPPHRCGLVLADRLGVAAVVFPGDHGGFGTRVDEFAAGLRQVLQG
jgi:pimeloyl-ACP methyl ester carboxylesterase